MNFGRQEPHAQAADGPGITGPSLPETTSIYNPRRELLESFGCAIYPLRVEDPDANFSTDVLNKLARGLSTPRWTPDPAILLGALRPKEMVDLLLFTKAGQARHNLVEAFCSFAGLDRELFQKALCLKGTPTASAVTQDRNWCLNAYSLLCAVREPLDTDRIRKTLARFAKSESMQKSSAREAFDSHWLYLRDPEIYLDKDCAPGSSVLSGFGEVLKHRGAPALKPFRTVISDTMYGSLYMDAPMGILLSHKQIPQAMCCFFTNEQDPKRLHIKQIQGLIPFRPEAKLGQPARYPVRGLPKLHWEQALVAIVEELASSRGFTSVEITSAANNPWNGHKNQGTMRTFSEVNARRRYDRTASALGYTRPSEESNFIKEL